MCVRKSQKNQKKQKKSNHIQENPKKIKKNQNKSNHIQENPNISKNINFFTFEKSIFSVSSYEALVKTRL